VESDPAAGIGVLAAFGAGLVSFLSPCVLPLVPGYLSVISGVGVGELDEARWYRVAVPALLFIAAFSAFFILLGLTATAVGDVLHDHRELLTDLSGILIIVMGCLFVASFFVPRLSREWHVDALLERAGTGGPLVAGAAFAVAWTPCVGLTLGPILSAAALSDSAGHGAFLLAVYSAGLGVPFLAAALAFSRMATLFDAVKRHYSAVIAAGGAILIVMGVAILAGWFTDFNVWAQKATQSLGLDV
jgi:cytochrome c-type biogenesis protein